MPPDPSFDPLIQLMQAMPPFSDATLAAIRSATWSDTESRDNELAEDREIAGPAGPIHVRIYRACVEGVLPLVVFFHGGGFVCGSTDTHDAFASSVTAALNCVTLSVDYRLAPEHPFPAAPDDCVAALSWGRGHAAELGADAARVFVMGDSAGGNLAAVAALRARADKAPPLAGQVLIYPVTDFTAPLPAGPDGRHYILTPQSLDYFCRAYLPDESRRRDANASPVLATDLHVLPPTLIVTAEYDPLAEQGAAFAAKLRAAQVDTTLIHELGAVHGFMMSPGAITRRSFDSCIAWMRERSGAGAGVAVPA
jgi:acetyl esterase